jgi:hypothetical protein
MVANGRQLIHWLMWPTPCSQHNQSTHADTAKSRVITFVVDGLPTFPDISKAADNSQ